MDASAVIQGQTLVRLKHKSIFFNYKLDETRACAGRKSDIETVVRIKVQQHWQCWIVDNVVNLGCFMFSNLCHGSIASNQYTIIVKVPNQHIQQQTSIQVIIKSSWALLEIFSVGKMVLDHRGFCVAVLWLSTGIKLAAWLTVITYPCLLIHP